MLKQHFPKFLAALILLFLVVLSLVTPGYFGGADNISHYFISRYAFDNPVLFLDSWGRPLYTLLSAPFAQLGLAGAKLLNVLLAWGTAWLAYLAAKELKIRPAAPAMLFACFAPLYLVMIPTALTEILFGFLLMLGSWLALRRKYIPAAIAWSLLPFARTEGYVLLPFLLPLFLWKRQYRAVPFLAAGTLLFSGIGGIWYHDVFWLINRFPYPVNYTHPVYRDTGSLWHFTGQMDQILGIPLLLLFVAGVTGMVAGCFSRDGEKRRSAVMTGLLGLLPFLVYLALHSFLFRKAMGGSMGLVRVMAAVLPAASLVALKGMSDGLNIIRGTERMKTVVAALFTGAIIVTPFFTYEIPTPLSPEEETIRRATTWLKESPWKDRLLYYADNNVPFHAGANPLGYTATTCHMLIDHKYLDTVPTGAVFVWDAHFGPNESKIPLDSLLQNPRYKVIACFRPLKPWITLGGGWYECCLTTVLPPGQTADNYAIRDSLLGELDAAGDHECLYLNTFDRKGDVRNNACLSSDTLRSRPYACRLDDRTEFSPGLCVTAGEIPDEGGVRLIRASLFYLLPVRDTTKNTLFVVSVEHRGKPYHYVAAPLNRLRVHSGRWKRAELIVHLTHIYSPDDLVKVYVWNPDRQRLFLDDFRVEGMK